MRQCTDEQDAEIEFPVMKHRPLAEADYRFRFHKEKIVRLGLTANPKSVQTKQTASDDASLPVKKRNKPPFKLLQKLKAGQMITASSSEQRYMLTLRSK